jgi:myo-inositol 2-dehydrogenase/D-chiro-inositol 1-dehydrogenase
MIKFAQFGAGFIGKIHGANIAKHPRAELTYIYDTYPASAEELAAKLGAKVASSPEEIWASNVDAVLIASTTNTHADLLSSAIQAGKPIYCENRKGD